MKNKVKKKGMLVIVAFLLVILLNIIFIKYSSYPKTYDQIKTNEKDITSVLDNNYKNSKKTTIVLYKNSCPYCKRVEGLITRKISKNHNQSFIIIDVSKLNQKQSLELVKKVPDLPYKGHLVTPTIAKLQRSKDGNWNVQSKVIGDDKKEIKKILSSKKASYLSVKEASRKVVTHG